ncbi:hypothetical protein DFH09DRAFT_1303255 [Mycena vulgaris]|nr:hypothetical protein DFH09DRAFT_1303255 [Mycena vulgaris]
MPNWEPYLREDILTWIYIFTDGIPWSWMNMLTFTSVLEHLFNLTGPLTGRFSSLSEKALGSISIVLTERWRNFDWSLSLDRFIQLAHSTASVIFFETFTVLDLPEELDSDSITTMITPDFKTKFLKPLQDALILAAEARGSTQAQDTQERASIIITDLASSISSERDDERAQSESRGDVIAVDWTGLKLSELHSHIDALRELRDAPAMLGPSMEVDPTPQ